MVFAVVVVVVCACLVVWRWCPWCCQLTRLRSRQWVTRTWRVARMSRQLHVFCYLQLFFCKFCCWPRRSYRRRSEAWICLICPRLPILGSPSFMVAFVVLALWRLTHLRRLSTSLDELRGVTHDALVIFVGEAALWFQGWSPWPSSLRLRGSLHKRFGALRWKHQSRPSWLVMASIASIVIGPSRLAIGDIVACCRLSQLA